MEVIIEDMGTKKMLEELLRKMQHPEPLLKILARYVRALTLQMFGIKMGHRPDTSPVRGVKWDPLAESTLRAKKQAVKKGKAKVAARPLERTGALKNSLISDSSIKYFPKGFSYGTDVKSEKGFPYPGVHQEGNARIPQRIWLFLKKEELKQMTITARDWLENKLKEMKV